MDSFLHHIHRTKVLIIGDIMLDRYYWGKVSRISPEAPVPIVRVQRTTETLGGACNVANNLVGLGCQAAIVGLCGIDATARKLRSMLDQKGIAAHLVADPARLTTTKTRVMAQKQQMIRLDEETAAPPSMPVLDQLVALIEQEATQVQAVIISDYAKGMFSDKDFVQKIVTTCYGLDLPVLVDPKGTDWQRYEGASCITPNIAELEAVAGTALEGNDPAMIAKGQDIRRRLGLTYLLVTRGAHGMCLIGDGDDSIVIDAQAREVFDVSGAGDTVIATLAACLAAGASWEEACRTANIAGGIVVGKLGTQPILFGELEAALAFHRNQGQHPYSASKIASLDTALAMVNQWKIADTTLVFTNGCFDLLHPGHISLLHQARAAGDRLIVGLNSDASVKRLKGDSRPILKEHDRAALLSALSCVDLVVCFEEDTPLALIQALRPDVLVKGADYALDQVVGRAEVEAYGGRVQLVSIVPGHSSTRLTQKMNR